VLNGKGSTWLRRHIRRSRAAPTHQVRCSQVLIDENGNVISANAVSGHPLLRAAAVAAAHASKLRLRNFPASGKVNGVIIYNFVAQ